MTRYLHRLRKYARANVEKLADSTQTVIVYTGPGELGYEAVERLVGETPTVQAGTVVNIGGAGSGSVEEMSADYRYDLKKDGQGPVIEVTTRVGVTGTSF